MVEKNIETGQAVNNLCETITIAHTAWARGSRGVHKKLCHKWADPCVAWWIPCTTDRQKHVGGFMHHDPICPL